MDLLIPVLKWSMNHFQWTHRSTHLVTKKIESSIVVLYLLTVVLCAFKVLQIYMCSNRVNSGWADRKIHATNAWSTYKICHFTMHRTMPAIIWQRQYMHHTINDLDWVKKVCCKSTIRLVGCICSGSLRTSENKKNACFRQKPCKRECSIIVVFVNKHVCTFSFINHMQFSISIWATSNLCIFLWVFLNTRNNNFLFGIFGDEYLFYWNY